MQIAYVVYVICCYVVLIADVFTYLLLLSREPLMFFMLFDDVRESLMLLTIFEFILTNRFCLFT